jgi:SAM-dependent methyltransferase
MDSDARLHSPAAERNRGPILAELLRLLPAQGALLEVASGTGQHAAHCAAALPGWTWWPSDPEPRSRESVAAWCAGLANVLPPLALDVLAEPWPGVPDRLDAVYCANMLHISPWATCAALMRGAAGRLRAGGWLLLYGPFLVEGEPTAPGNQAFDADLRQRDPCWGLRRLGVVAAEALAVGLVLKERIGMPANNLLLVFERQKPPTPGGPAG